MATTPTSQILFKIRPQEFNIFEQYYVYISRPRLVDYYELNYEKNYPAKIRFFKEPQLEQYPFDLNDGYETFRFRKTFHSTDLNETLQYAMSSRAIQDGHDGNVSADNVDRTIVYTRRGTLVSIMQSIYVKKYNDWNIRVARYNGNIYMVKEEIAECGLSFCRPENTHHNRLEQLLFAESPNQSPNINEPCDENIYLASVHRTNLDKYHIVYSGEIQGIIAEEEFEDFDDIKALNECRFVITKQIWNNLKHENKKFLNYWLQGYLSNVRDLYVAYKNRIGIVEEPIEHKIISELPITYNRFWKPEICTGFLYHFLKHVEKLMSNVDCLNTVYVFHYNQNEQKITYKIYSGKTEKSFISKEYMDFIQNQ